MSSLNDVTAFFLVEKIFDAVLAEGFAVAAAGEAGLAAVRIADRQCFRAATSVPLEGPILVSGDRVFYDRFAAKPEACGGHMEFAPFEGLAEMGLKDMPLPHYSFATKQCLYTLGKEGDLRRFYIEEGRCEVPQSQYGRYEHGDHRVLGIGTSRQGVIALSRYEGRAEHLLDSLPDDPTRHKARAAVLKDADFGGELSGPAVAGRWAYLYCREKNGLLSQHLRNPEVRHEMPAPAGMKGEDRPLLAGDGAGRVWAATRRGLHIVIGLGSPGFFEYPGGEEHEPLRLLADERFVLVTTKAGKLFLGE